VKGRLQHTAMFFTATRCLCLDKHARAPFWQRSNHDFFRVVEAHFVAAAIINWVVRVEARFAMESAFSSVPSFFERGCEANRKRWRARGRPKREKLEKVPKPDKALAEHAVDFDPLIYNIWKQQEKTALEPASRSWFRRIHLAEETTKQVEWALIVFEAIVYDALNLACGQKIDVLCKHCDYYLPNESLRLRAGNGLERGDTGA
jgi:hypothetical protein